MTTLDSMRLLFSGLELSDDIKDARSELADYLQGFGYETRIKVTAFDKIIDVVATKDNERLAILIGRYSIRTKKKDQLRELNKCDRVYLLRGNARIGHAVVDDVYVINVASKGSL